MSPEFALRCQDARIQRELFGGTGFYVERPEDIGNAFLEALNTDGPSIIEIPTDPDEMPRPARLSDVQAPQTGS